MKIKKIHFYREFHLSPTEDEIQEFIRTNKYFTNSLKEFLLKEFIIKVEQTIMTKKWENDFKDRIYLWANSFEWLQTVTTIKNLDNSIEPLSLFTIKI